MCGIVGYIGNKPAAPVILEGLRRLEYRGYDSAGIAVAGNSQGMQVRRAMGKLRNLEAAVSLNPLDGSYGIGHTRWATHGRPSENNAHPHRDCTGQVVVVHNGIIENYASLKKSLEEEGHQLATQTDTTHLSLAKDPQIPRSVQPPSLGRVIELSQVGGLHYRYERQAA